MKRTMRKTMRRSIISIVLAVALVIIPASGVFAAGNTVVVTATPAYVSISNDVDWVINDVDLNTGKTIVPSTTYYSNPLGDTTAPQTTVDDTDCLFTVTNTSTVATNIVVNFPNHSGGDTSTNGSGTAGANAFAAFGYVSGVAFSSKVTLLASGSGNLISALGATTNFKWGIQYDSQTGAWGSGDAMSSTVTITASPS